jgi:hypothetical protein
MLALQHLRLVVRVADWCVGEPPGDSSRDSPLSLDAGCFFAIMLHIMENTCSHAPVLCWRRRSIDPNCSAVELAVLICSSQPHQGWQDDPVQLQHPVQRCL